MVERLPGVHAVELQDLCIPPQDWIAQVISVAMQSGKVVRLDGASPDARETVPGNVTTYRVVTGEVVAHQLPWLALLYETYLAEHVGRVLSRPVSSAKNTRYGVNINVVEGAGGRYEWHVDPSPIAAVLFVTTHAAGAGGELVLRQADELARIHPRAGAIVIFEGRQIEHAVLPLVEDTTRISIPMLYYYSGEEQYFPRELDEYLYGGSTGD